MPAAASDDYGWNCVTYVRETTGMSIVGNAGDWWENAAGSYRRGHQPVAGAVMVFRPYGPMRYGHVALVSEVVNAREILVNQANWPHGDYVEGAAVYDVSPNNDWSTVRVANANTMSWGRLNPVYGFIYADRAPARDEPVVAEAQSQPGQVQVALAHVAHVALSPLVALVQFAQPQAQAASPQPVQPQPRAEPSIAQAQPQTTQPQVAQPQPRPPLAIAEPEKTKANTPATPKALAAAKRERAEQLAEAMAARAKPDRHERLEAKAGRDKAQQEKLAQAKADKAEQIKFARAEREKAEQAEQAKVAQAKAAKAERIRLAKAEREKADQEKLAKAEQAKRQIEARIAGSHEHPPTHHTHIARNDQQAPVQGANIEQIAEVGHGGE